MTRPAAIFASLLGADPLRLAQEVAAVEPHVDGFHIDVMDYHFADNAFGSPTLVSRLREVTDKPVECHLMVADPTRLISRFATAGADSLIVHAEAVPESRERRALADAIREAGARPGLALLLETPLVDVADDLPWFSTVLVVTVESAGFGGQGFSPHAPGRVRDVRALCDTLADSPVVQVDGGIDAVTAARTVASGADALVVGSACFAPSDPAARLAQLRGLPDTR